MTQAEVDSSKLTLLGSSEIGLASLSATESCDLDLNLDKCLAVKSEVKNREMDKLDRAIEEIWKEFEVNYKKMDDNMNAA